MRQLLLLNKILLTSFLAVGLQSDPIGDVTDISGSGSKVLRTNETYDPDLDFVIVSFDDVRTGQGRLEVTFVDDTTLKLTEHSKVIIDEVVYDPDPNKSKMAMRFAAGTARFATGKIGLVPKKNISITTPSANIAIRGTDFTTTVDEIGRSLVILLPDANGNASGEIDVITAGGTITLNEAYQATMVPNFESPPSQPLILDLDLNMIDNMFIVSPPKEIQKQEEEQQANSNGGNNLLDIDLLEENILEEDPELSEDKLEFTELDIDLLDVDLLIDVLEVMEEIETARASGSSTNTSGDGAFIKGTTAPGFDKVTNFNTLIDTGSGKVTFFRDAGGVVSIKLSVEANATLNTTNNTGATSEIITNEGGAISIIIRQNG
jgi:hypothetical protein